VNELNPDLFAARVLRGRAKADFFAVGMYLLAAGLCVIGITIYAIGWLSIGSVVLCALIASGFFARGVFRWQHARRIELAASRDDDARPGVAGATSGGGSSTCGSASPAAWTSRPW
jgi:hypothetical protein